MEALLLEIVKLREWAELRIKIAEGDAEEAERVQSKMFHDGLSCGIHLALTQMAPLYDKALECLHEDPFLREVRG